MREKKAESCVPIHDLIARRWSSRAFDPDRSISPDVILALLEAARWAPSCGGDQPWRYVLCHRATHARPWELAYACLSPGNQSWAGHAPLLILVVADNFMGDGRYNRWGQYDTGAATLNLSLQALDQGLIAHQMGGFDSNRVRRVFGIPAQCTPMAIVAVGYPAGEESLAEDLRTRERQPRSRKPLAENFYEGRWGEKVKVINEM